MNRNINTTGIIIVGAIVLAILAFIIYIISVVVQVTNTIARSGDSSKISQMATSVDNPNEGDNIAVNTNSLPVEYIIKVYSITYNTTKDKTKTYQLDDIFSINTELISSEKPVLKFTVNNGKSSIEDTLLNDDEKLEKYKRDGYFKFNYYRVGNYLCFTSHYKQDDEFLHLYVVDKNGNLYKDIYELDNTKGTKPTKIEFTSDRITIQTNTDNLTYEYIIDETGNIDFNNPICQ